MTAGTHLVVFALALAGFALLALVMTPRGPAGGLRRRLLAITGPVRLAGFGSLIAAGIVAIASAGPALGLVGWFGHLSLAAGVVFVAGLRDRPARPDRSTRERPPVGASER
ncbi:MAG: DUF3325 family protein [Lautropia sp.]